MCTNEIEVSLVYLQWFRIIQRGHIYRKEIGRLEAQTLNTLDQGVVTDDTHVTHIKVNTL